MSAVWKHLKLSEKDAKIITSTDNERLFSTALQEEEWLKRVTVWWLKSPNGLKRLVNKLQNIMFSNTHTDCKQRCTSLRHNCLLGRVQSPKLEENLTVTCQLLSKCFIYFQNKIKKWDNNNDNNNYNSSINTFIITLTHSVQIGICNIF